MTGVLPYNFMDMKTAGAHVLLYRTLQYSSTGRLAVSVHSPLVPGVDLELKDWPSHSLRNTVFMNCTLQYQDISEISHLKIPVYNYIPLEQRGFLQHRWVLSSLSRSLSFWETGPKPGNEIPHKLRITEKLTHISSTSCIS